MLSIAIYSTQTEDIGVLKTLIQNFLIEAKSMAKVTLFTDSNELFTAPHKYDIYFMDMDTEEDVLILGKQKKIIDNSGHFVYVSSNPNSAQLAAKNRADYFITKPYDETDIKEILTEIKTQVKEDSFIIKIPTGDRRIRLNNLNYVNIVRRCLCYHLKDGNMFDGQTLRTSFEKAIDPIQHHKAFLFLAPSLLINLSEIKIINADHIIFENDDILYFPKKQYDTVRNAWINYNKID